MQTLAIAPSTLQDDLGGPTLPGRDNDRASSAQLASLAVLGLASPSSRRNYSREIARYLESSYGVINREQVQRFLARRSDEGCGASSLNVALAAVRLLATEANARGLLPDNVLVSIERIRGYKRLGQRVGNWLGVEGVKELLRAAQKKASVRDAALVASMVGCGLRRAEVVSLEWSQWQQRDGRWVWIDVCGKGKRLRSVPAADWVVAEVERWHEESIALRTHTGDVQAHAHGRVFAFTAQAAYLIVQQIAREAGVGEIRPHDLRRTYARLSREGGASLEQIQQTLGHASVQTTERYLGTQLEMRAGMACGDHIRL